MSSFKTSASAFTEIVRRSSFLFPLLNRNQRRLSGEAAVRDEQGEKEEEEVADATEVELELQRRRHGETEAMAVQLVLVTSDSEEETTEFGDARYVRVRE